MRSPLRAVPALAHLTLAPAVAPAHAATSAKPAKTAQAKAADPFPAFLPRGKTIKGVWSVVGQGTAFATSTISFQFPLAKTPKAIVIPRGIDATSLGCPGNVANPLAGRGKICIYSGPVSVNLGGFGSIGAVNGQEQKVDKFGVILFARGKEADQPFAVHGTYAVTGA